jgi:hypothetical protein
MNVHSADKGRRIRALTTAHRRHLATGGDTLLHIPPGLPGRVEAVESHGHNPWTLYTIRFADGTFATGMAFASDFCFNDGDPNQRRSAR